MREAEVGLEQLNARPGCVLVPVRDYNTLKHLDWAVVETDTDKRDIVVLTIRLLEGDDLLTDYEQVLFTRVVSVAERHGRAVKLLVVPGANAYDAIARTAARLQAHEIVLGGSATNSADTQALQLGEVWDRVPRDAELVTQLVIHEPSLPRHSAEGATAGSIRRFSLGAHAPSLAPEDIERIHLLWVEAVKAVGPGVHHRDIVSAALSSLQDELAGEHHDAAVARLQELVTR
jgi:hypothetical protein